MPWKLLLNKKVLFLLIANRHLVAEGVKIAVPVATNTVKFAGRNAVKGVKFAKRGAKASAKNAKGKVAHAKDYVQHKAS